MSVPLVRLPGYVNDDEVRVYWNNTEGREDVHVWGPRSIARFALSIFTEKKTVLNEDKIDIYTARREGMIQDEPSVLDNLESAGYDPKTIVFSIRKKNSIQPVAEVPDDLRKKLEVAQQAISQLQELLSQRDEAKGVFVFSDKEFWEIQQKVRKANTEIEAALNVLPNSI